MRRTRYIVSLAILLSVAFSLGLVLELNAAVGVTVSPILPENQVPETKSFFDIWATPGQQEIAILVSNNRAEPITMEIDIFSPATGANGSIDYTSSGRHDTSMIHFFEDIAWLTTDREITVPANGSKIVPIIINIPSEGFDGIIMGSVHALLGITPEEEAEAGMIVNRFAFALPVRLRGNNYTGIEPNFSIGDVDIQSVNYRAAIVADIHNSQPRLLSGALVSAQIYQAGSNTAIFEVSDFNVDFAPNTIFPLTMQDRAGTGVSGGNYTLNVQIEHDGIRQNFQEVFHIEPVNAARVNAIAVNQVQPHLEQTSQRQFSSICMIAAGAVALLAMVALIFVVNSSRARRNEIALLKEQLKKNNTDE